MERVAKQLHDKIATQLKAKASCIFVILKTWITEIPYTWRYMTHLKKLTTNREYMSPVSLKQCSETNDYANGPAQISILEPGAQSQHSV